MNLSLLDPFAVAQDFPDTLGQSIEFGHNYVAAFNLSGDYLALGSDYGLIGIYDFGVNRVVKTLKGHTQVIRSIQWSSCGRYILSASKDCTVVLWDLATSTTLRRYDFDEHVVVAEMHPIDKFAFIVILQTTGPYYVNFENEDSPVVMPIKLEDPAEKLLSATASPSDSREESPADERNQPSRKKYRQARVTSLVFSKPRGNYVFFGTSRGALIIVSTATKKVLARQKQIGGILGINGMIINTLGNYLALNCDRVVRQVNLPLNLDEMSDEEVAEWAGGPEESETDGEEPPEPTDDKWREKLQVVLSYQEIIGKIAWNSVAFSLKGDFICASTHDTEKKIYLWETGTGTLLKILECPRDEIVHVVWNPRKAMIAGCDISGTIYIWAVPIPQQWSALAPDFVEIEENVEYEEKEDEFDIESEAGMNQRLLEDEEDVEVDVITKSYGVNGAKAYMSNGSHAVSGGFSSLDEIALHSFVIPVDLEEDEIVEPESDDD